MNDKIIIKELQCRAHIGITAQERAKKQPIIVDIEIVKDTREAGRLDDILKTVNYSSVCKEICVIMNVKYKTIEALAEKVSTTIRTTFPVKNVRVMVKKPQALRKYGAAYAAIEIER